MDAQALLQRATELVSRGCGIELVKVLELEPGGDTLLIRAGVNWKPGVVGHVRFGTGSRSPAGYALMTDGPVVSYDVANESRFQIPPVLIEHGIKSMVNVPIRTESGPYGVLEVDAPEPRGFDEHDVNFLLTYANLLGAAINRIDAQRKLERTSRELRIAAHELQHRVKNILANVHALARRTAEASPTLEQFMAAFEERLRGLSRTQELLLNAPGADLPLGELVRRELAAHGAEDGRHYRMAGEPIAMGARAAMVLGMVIHELATNAVKHGALAVDGGHIDIAWSLTREGEVPGLRLVWRERGIPLGEGTPSRSVGRDIIENTVPYMLDGEVDWHLGADGVTCIIGLPLACLSEPDELAL
jgi:two-component sensor histidine kinase